MINIAKSIQHMTDDNATNNDLLRGVCEGISNLSEMQNNKMAEMVSALHYIAHQQQEQIKVSRELVEKLSALGSNISHTGFQAPPVAVAQTAVASDTPVTFKQAMERIPLMIAEKTFNTSHPDYDANMARNFPGKILGHKRKTDNALYKEMQKLTQKDPKTGEATDMIADETWDPILKEMLEEAKTVPGAEQVFERKEFIEKYMSDMSAKYQAHYIPGWVNLADALFLYWVIRKHKPKTVVQTGVCNGLSSAFMMLALAKNGNEGQLHVIDLAAVFDPNNPDWTVKDKIYGVVIPEGKTSGWIVPDMYQGKRFHVQNGDAKELMPKLIDKLSDVDMFYHDSDHTYNHMMFEFREAKRKLKSGGLILGDDISWNASVWDFADEYDVPSYNYKGTVGVAFF